MERILKRFQIVRSALLRPWIIVIILIWGAIGTWDLFVAQFLPLEWAEDLPRIYDLIIATSGWLSWKEWILVGVILIAGAAVEYAFRLHPTNNMAHPKNDDEKNLQETVQGPAYWSLAETLTWVAFGEANTAKKLKIKFKSDGIDIRPQEEIESFDKAESLLFEALRGEKIYAFGKKDNSQQYEDIPPKYFLSDVECAILHDQIDVNPGNITAKRYWDGPKWCDVRIKREAVLALWPKGKEGFAHLEYISLQDAARQLYTQARKTDRLAVSASEWGETESDVLDWWGAHIAQTKKARIFGERPPSNELEEIDHNEVMSMHVENAALALTSLYSKSDRYINLKILSEDKNSLLEELQNRVQKGNAQNTVPQVLDAPLVRDTDMRDAIYFAIVGRWPIGDEKYPKDYLSPLDRALTEFRQSARNDDLHIWGRPSRTAPYELIPPVYWRYAQIETLGAVMGDTSERVTTQVAEPGYTVSEIYHSLMVNKLEVEKLCHAANT